MLRLLSVFLILSFALCSFGLAETLEAKTTNFLTEFDITFFQTAPIMIFWSYIVDSQVSSIVSLAGAPHWELILGASALISAGNAYLHAKKVVAGRK